MSQAKTTGVWRSAASLGLVAILGTTLLAGVAYVTKERIAQQERRVILEQLGQIVPTEAYDNELLLDRISFSDETYFPNGQTVTVYRARMGTEPVAVVLRFAAVNGYNGEINLLAGINADGTVNGVRVVSHKETPGLGDVIELEKSNWISGLSGRSLENPGRKGWAVKRDGGEFDQFTGATITPRAVVNAVRLALEHFELNKSQLFAMPSETTAMEGT
jgi:electron transport complex protein RnfG